MATRERGMSFSKTSDALQTKREAVDKALRLVLQMEGQKKILALEGKLKWEGDLDEMRRD